LVKYLTAAFSLSMLPSDPLMTLTVEEISIERVKEELRDSFISAVGHPDTAKLLSELLGMNVPANRVAIKLNHGDNVIVFQLLTRLPEGKVLSKEELERLPFKFYKVTLL